MYEHEREAKQEHQTDPLKLFLGRSNDTVIRIVEFKDEHGNVYHVKDFNNIKHEHEKKVHCNTFARPFDYGCNK